jgi:hypothetical protein
LTACTRKPRSATALAQCGSHFIGEPSERHCNPRISGSVVTGIGQLNSARTCELFVGRLFCGTLVVTLPAQNYNTLQGSACRRYRKRTDSHTHLVVRQLQQCRMVEGLNYLGGCYGGPGGSLADCHGLESREHPGSHCGAELNLLEAQAITAGRMGEADWKAGKSEGA